MGGQCRVWGVDVVGDVCVARYHLARKLGYLRTIEIPSPLR